MEVKEPSLKVLYRARMGKSKKKYIVCPQCLKITQNVAFVIFKFLAFLMNFYPLKQQTANVARFARYVSATFSVIFKHCALCRTLSG